MDVKIDTVRFSKVNECVGGRRFGRGRESLFDEFWREGELALMVGPGGVGKSVLAVQIADALARGREWEGFEMLFRRRKVLYVDLSLSERQFAERYYYYSPNARLYKAYKFAEGIYRSRPPKPEELCDWLESAVREGGFDAVIVDDLTAVKRTHDGIRETLAVMRRLKQICDETGVAILAIAACDTPRAGQLVSERDMGRSRILCTVADSVFALGPGKREDQQCLVQLRSRNSTVFWTERNAPAGKIERLENGLLGFLFDERFHPYIDNATVDLIKRIRRMRKLSKTFKAIAEELGISKTRAFNLHNKWVPEKYGVPEKEDDFDDDDELDEEELTSSPPYKGGVAAASADGGVLPDTAKVRVDAREEREHLPLIGKEGSGYVALEGDAGLATGNVAENHPVSGEKYTPRPQYGPGRVSVYDLTRGLDANGDEIFIQSTDQNTGRPTVWYQFNRRRQKVKFIRTNLGRSVFNLGETEYL